MRLFVAVPVPQELREKAAALGAGIMQDGVSAVRAENMHLTLKFIGETQDSELETIKERLADVKFAPFTCTLRGVGVFPNENYIKVVWAGCESGGALERLAKDVIAALHGHGADERFSAHLTIARVKRKLDLRAFLEGHKEETLGAFEVAEFHLIQSVLGPGGPSYTTLARFPAR